MHLRLATTLTATACCLLLVAPATGQTPDARPRPAVSPSQAEECRRLLSTAWQLRRAGRTAEALAACRTALARHREVFGGEHEQVAGVLGLLADLLEDRDDFTEAARVRRDVLALRRKLHGNKDWRVTEARLDAEDTARLARLDEDGRDRFRTARRLNDQVYLFYMRGRYREALPLARRALALNAAFGKKHRAYALSLHNVGSQLARLGQPAEAEKFFRQAAILNEATLGADHPAARNTLGFLAQVLRRQANQRRSAGEFPAAEKLFEEVLTIRTRLNGPRHPDTADARLDRDELRQWARLSDEQRAEVNAALELSGKVYELYQARRYREALPLARRVLDVAGRVVGKEHRFYALALLNVGSQHLGLGQFAEAEEAYRTLLDLHRRLHGEDHRDYRVALQSMAALHEAKGHTAKAAGDFTAAGRSFAEYLALCRRLYGPDDWRTIDARLEVEGIKRLAVLKPQDRAELAEVERLGDQVYRLWEAGRSREALPLAEKVRATYRRLFGEDHPRYAGALINVGAQHERLGAYDKAEALYLQAKALYERRVGTRHPYYAQVLSNLGTMYGDRGKHDRAEPLLRQALAIRQQALGDRDPLTEKAVGNLAGALEDAGSALLKSLSPDAVAKYREALALRQRRHAPGHWRTASTRLSLDMAEQLARLSTEQRGRVKEAGRLHERAADLFKARQPDEALACAHKAVALVEQVLGADSPHLAGPLSTLAYLHREKRELDRAEELYRRVLALRKRAPGTDHPSYADSLGELAWVYEARGDFARAAGLFRQGADIIKNTVGEKHRRYATALSNIARALSGQGDNDGAIAHARRALELEAVLHGPEHRLYVLGLSNLATLMHRRGDDKAAEGLARRAIAALERAGRTDSPDYTHALTGLALVLRDRGELPQAQALLEKGLAIEDRGGRQKTREYATLLEALAGVCQARHDFSRAEKLFGQGVKLTRDLFGDKHHVYALALNNLALFHHARGDTAGGLELARQSVALIRAALGRAHPDHVTAVANLATLYEADRQYDRAEPLLLEVLEVHRGRGDSVSHAHALNNLGKLYYEQGKYARSEELYLEALRMFRKILGDRHPKCALCLSNLGLLLKEAGQYDRAEKAGLEALAIRKALPTRGHEYGIALQNLGGLYAAMGELDKAEKYYLEALALWKGLVGEEHLYYASALGLLCGIYMETNRPEATEELFLRVVRLMKRSVGERHPLYAKNLNNLASFYQDRGDFSRAEALRRQALELRRRALGEKHPDYGNSLETLGKLYGEVRDLPRSIDLYRRALAVYKGSLGDRHPDYVHCLGALAWVYVHAQNYEEAERLQRQALEVSKTFGAKHAEYANGLYRLSVIFKEKGDLDEAERLGLQALRHTERARGKGSYEYSADLNNLALIYIRRGQHARALSLLEEVQSLGEKLGVRGVTRGAMLHNLAITYYALGKAEKALPLLEGSLADMEKLVEESLAALSERQRLDFLARMRRQFESYLSVARAARMPAEKLYAHVLVWKGAVTLRQFEERLARSRPALKPLLAELTAARDGLSRLALRVPPPARRKAWLAEIERLRQKKEDVEARLARQSAEFRRQQGLNRLGPAEVAAALPAGTVLLDCYEYRHTSVPAADKPAVAKSRLLVFVVRRGHKPVLVDLGKARVIEKAVGEWRVALHGDVRRLEDARAEVAKLVWAPLKGQVAGADTVLVAPDGALARMPLQALPGKKDGSYLLEDLALATVLSGRHAAEVYTTAPDRPAGGGLLALGGIDYDASLKADAPARGGFAPLPGTAVEARAIHDLFRKHFADGRTLLLTGGEAREKRLKEELAESGGKKGWRYLHFAGHGFFAPPTVLSALGTGARDRLECLGFMSRAERAVLGRNPMLLSGLALAGANRPRQEGGTGEDGILTAEEVRALDLRATDLVVLSACETGLGTVAGGEGVLGLQRAFQIAGAQTLVTSLWKVDDAATALLMESFYLNLWQKKLSRVEALRQAQLTVLREPRRVEQRRKLLAAELAKRGIKLGSTRPLPDGGRIQGRSHPALWAAFVLSGDVR
jgi:tetratricopeptide (TPR) repeat protein/CHAT domain-containing protein